MFDPMQLDYLELVEPQLRNATWELHFCIIPRQCLFSKNLIWFSQCYRGKKLITGPGEPVVKYFYASKTNFLFWLLK